LHDLRDERPVVTERKADISGECGPAVRINEPRNLLEAAADPRQPPEQRLGARLVLSFWLRAECRLADEPRRRLATGLSAGGNPREFLGMEAEEFGRGAS
jgi:hypothetical protein